MSDLRRKLVSHKPGEWPEAISDGLTLACEVCGQTPDFDYHVTDDAWGQVIPAQWQRSVVCLPCFANLALSYGVWISDVLEFVQFTGPHQTVVLKPVESYQYWD